jgi:hypothetical protein
MARNGNEKRLREVEIDMATMKEHRKSIDMRMDGLGRGLLDLRTLVWRLMIGLGVVVLGSSIVSGFIARN